MKQSHYLLGLIIILLLLTCFTNTSCSSNSRQKIEAFDPTAGLLKAKLRCVERYSELVQYDQLIIRKIDPMYRVGEHIYYNNVQYEIMEAEQRPFVHVVYPEEMLEVSRDYNAPSNMQAYQHGDTLELRFSYNQ